MALKDPVFFLHPKEWHAVELIIVEQYTFWASHLWHKHQTEGDCAAENNDKGYDAELHIRLIPRQEGHSCTDDAHDSHIVHTHPDVLAVIQSRDADVPCLPGQETTKQLQQNER